jgi:hypothetical protein
LTVSFYKSPELSSIPAGREGRLFLFLRATRPLGGLQGVDLLGVFLDYQLNVGGPGAIAHKPSAGRIHVYLAEATGRQLDYLAAAFAFFHNRFTSPILEGAAIALHEHTIGARSDRLTNHLFHLKKKLVFLTNNHGSVKDKGVKTWGMN